MVKGMWRFLAIHPPILDLIQFKILIVPNLMGINKKQYFSIS
jgi:hypothetical protein